MQNAPDPIGSAAVVLYFKLSLLYINGNELSNSFCDFLFVHKKFTEENEKSVKKSMEIWRKICYNIVNCARTYAHDTQIRQKNIFFIKKTKLVLIICKIHRNPLS